MKKAPICSAFKKQRRSVQGRPRKPPKNDGKNMAKHRKKWDNNMSILYIDVLFLRPLCCCFDCSYVFWVVLKFPTWQQYPPGGMEKHLRHSTWIPQEILCSPVEVRNFLSPLPFVFTWVLGPSQVGCDRQISNEPSNIFTFTLPGQLTVYTVSFPITCKVNNRSIFWTQPKPPNHFCSSAGWPKITYRFWAIYYKSLT